MRGTPVVGAAGVAYPAGQLAHVGEGPFREGLDLFDFHDVGGHRQRAPAERPDLLGNGFDFVGTPGGHHHVGAGIGEPEREPFADAAPAAGDHGDLSVEFEAIQYAHAVIPCSS